MTRIFPLLALSTALAFPAVRADADRLDETSPARMMLRQLMAVMPLSAHHRGQRFDWLAGDYRPTALRGPRGVLRRLVPGAETWLTIDPDGALRYSLGCNRYWTQIEPRRHGEIAVQPVIGTRMACERRVARQENRVSAALRDAVRVDLRYGRVVFLDRWGAVTLELAPSGFRSGGGWHERSDRW